MAVSLAKPVSSMTQQMKHTSDLSSKQLFEAKWKTFESEYSPSINTCLVLVLFYFLNYVRS